MPLARRQQTSDPNFVHSNGLGKVRLGGKPARTSLDVEPENGEPVSDMNCSSTSKGDTRLFLNSMTHSGTITRQKLTSVVSSIGGPLGRRSRVGLNLSNGLRLWAVLVMSIAPTLRYDLVWIVNVVVNDATVSSGRIDSNQFWYSVRNG
jgi:hypothetical protein